MTWHAEAITLILRRYEPGKSYKARDRFASVAMAQLMEAGRAHLRGFLGEGIRLEGGGGSTLEENTVEGGTDAIVVVDSPDNRIAANALTGSAGSAVRVLGAASTGNRILGNRIVRPRERGIALEGEGRSSPGRPVPGPNTFQPAPRLDTVDFVRVDDGRAVEARIEGTLAAAPRETYLVEVFATDLELAKEGALSADRRLTSAAALSWLCVIRL